jgi:7-cyano-7-deazaguanine synthase
MYGDYKHALPKSGSRVVLLLSGGIDSAALAALLKNQLCEVLALHVDYGQRAASTEWKAVKRVCSELGLPRPTAFDMSAIGKLLSSEIVQTGKRKPAKAVKADKFAVDFLPHRNALLVSLAATLAAEWGASHVALGIIGGGENAYPDTSIVFLKKLQALFKTAPKIIVSAPFAGMTKRQVVRIAKENGLKIASTFSCNAKAERHCGRCPSCIERRWVI